MPKKRKKLAPGDPAAIYARYSSHNQKDASIEQQVEQATQYAADLGLNVIEIYADRAISGKTDRRPNFQRLMRDAQLGKFRAVLAWKSSRLGRNMLQSMQNEQLLDDCGVAVLYTEEDFDDTAAGRFAARSMMNVNQFYIENMAEDVRRGMRDNASNCKCNGVLPYGYRATAAHDPEIDESKAEVVREIYRRILSGDCVAEIMRDLNLRGIKTRLGNAWNKNSFYSILHNERYTGVYIYDDIRIDGGIPAIIDRETFDRVQEVLKMRKSVKGRRGSSDADYLLTGKLFCGYCGSPMVGLSGTGKSGTLHHYYACQGRRLKQNCEKEHVRKDKLESAVAAAIYQSLSSPSVVNWIADQAVAYSEKEQEQSHLAMFEQELAQTQLSLQNLLKAIEQGIITPTTRARMLELEQQENRLKHRIASERASLIMVTRDDVLSWLELVRSGDVTDKSFQQTLFQNFLRAVYCYDDHLKIVCNFSSKDRDITIPSPPDLSLSHLTPSCSYKALCGVPRNPLPLWVTDFLHIRDSKGCNQPSMQQNRFGFFTAVQASCR